MSHHAMSTYDSKSEPVQESADSTDALWWDALPDLDLDLGELAEGTAKAVGSQTAFGPVWGNQAACDWLGLNESFEFDEDTKKNFKDFKKGADGVLDGFGPLAPDFLGFGLNMADGVVDGEEIDEAAIGAGAKTLGGKLSAVLPFFGPEKSVLTLAKMAADVTGTEEVMGVPVDEGEKALSDLNPGKILGDFLGLAAPAADNWLEGKDDPMAAQKESLDAGNENYWVTNILDSFGF